MSLKYTKGYWFKDNGYDGEIRVEVNGDDRIIVDQYWVMSGYGVDDEDEQLGNIQLIVNAPLMYESIKKFLETGDSTNLKLLVDKIENE